MKGLHKVAPQRGGVYYYAWRGGPRMAETYGTPAFVVEWKALTAARETPIHHAGTLQSLITAYQKTPAFLGLAPSTKDGYIRRIRKIETAFGDMPIDALADPRVRGDFLDWRDKIGQTSLREADYHFSVLALILAWAYDRRRIAANPCEKPGRLYRADRVNTIWTEAQLDAFLAVASQAVALPMHLALWTGQRQGDILALTWTAYDGQVIRLRQSKTGRHLTIPAAEPLRAILDAAKGQAKRAVTICTTTRGGPWTSDGFRASFGKAQDAAKITGPTFHDLRGTAVTRLALAGCTVPEIASITGHALKDVEAMLDRHYLSRDRGLAESAVAKLEKNRSGTVAVKHAVKQSTIKDT